MRRSRALSVALVRVGGAAAVVGGLMWSIKAAGILLTGDQPPLLFEVAMPLFAVGLLGLYGRLDGHGGRLGKAGVAVACVALVSAVAALLTGLAPFVAVAGFGPFLGLCLLGWAISRAGLLPLPWRYLPLAIGLGGPPMVFVGGALSIIDERLLEVPILLIGLAWILLGYAVLAAGDGSPARTR